MKKENIATQNDTSFEHHFTSDERDLQEAANDTAGLGVVVNPGALKRLVFDEALDEDLEELELGGHEVVVAMGLSGVVLGEQVVSESPVLPAQDLPGETELSHVDQLEVVLQFLGVF